MLKPLSSNLTFFEAIDIETLIFIMKQMKTKTSFQDPIPTDVLKKCLVHVAPLLLHIINQSIEESIFPDLLKHAKIFLESQ